MIIGYHQHDKAYAQIKRMGRWTYRIKIMAPLMGNEIGLDDANFESAEVFGRRRAERKALRMIKRHVRDYSWLLEPEYEVYQDKGDK